MVWQPDFEQYEYTEVSVSSRSYILSYKIIEKVKNLTTVRFPSPLGVIFSLIVEDWGVKNQYVIASFRLLSELYSLLCAGRHTIVGIQGYVSVSSRSYILSYFLKTFIFSCITTTFPSPLGVIFSLIILVKTCQAIF